MSTYLLAHRAPRDYRGSPEAMAAWNAWFEQLGPNLVDRGNPVFNRATLGAATSDTNLGGYTLIEADDLAAAVKLAEGCPMVGWGGGVEVGELMVLNAGRGPAPA